MNSQYLLLLVICGSIISLLTGSVFADNAMEIQHTRDQAVIQHFDLKPVSDKKVKLPKETVLSEKAFSDLGFKSIRYEVSNREEDSVAAEKLYILGKEGQTTAFVKIYNMRSDRAAQEFLLDRIVRTCNLPIEDVLTNYKKVDAGPGEINLLSWTCFRDDEQQQYGKYVGYFVKGNVFITINSFTKEIKVIDLAMAVESLVKE